MLGEHISFIYLSFFFLTINDNSITNGNLPKSMKLPINEEFVSPARFDLYCYFFVYFNES